jgi:hypothetical protein
VYVSGLFKGNFFCFFNAYLEVFGLFLPKKKKKLPTENNLEKYYKKSKCG